MQPKLTLTHTVPDEDREAILAELLDYNNEILGESSRGEIYIPLKDQEGETEGGLIGYIGRGWLYIELLFVPDHLRDKGLAGKMLRMAEEEAKDRGCTGVYIDTLNPIARRVYERQGYEAFSTLDGFSKGSSLTWLKKKF
ncbi:GNAT family N-acetyltransferase [Agrobacterium sp. ES01]|uniref:GNAT family N-acetyltransferase n=1 Tax=Agrobacterium sp. ES01 TaxID=3420714 RepID=UPI003D133B58